MVTIITLYIIYKLLTRAVKYRPIRYHRIIPTLYERRQARIESRRKAEIEQAKLAMRYQRIAEQERRRQYQNMLKCEKERIKKELARADIDRTEVQKQTWIQLLDLIESEITECASQTRLEALLRKKAQAETQLANLDRKIEKSYSILNLD